ncbi:MAG TPA: hypothetical protein P5531_10555 [Bacteroidales bacterium]|nr:hypothetical protein [Bacteroidales bacterium]HSA43597.1 hypothetical protein [Bacteroidales bacterium]
MNKEYQNAQDVTAEMIREWEERHGKVEIIDVPVSDELSDKVATFYLRRPTRMIVTEMAKLASANELDRANNLMIKNCVLGGDMIYLDAVDGEDSIYYAVLEAIGQLIEKKKATFRTR